MSSNYSYIGKAKKDLSREELKVVDKAMSKLTEMIDQYEEQKIPFEKILNNDVIKHKVLDHNFCVFKFSGSAKTQLRILYRYVRTSSDSYNLEIHLVHIKRSSQNRNHAGTQKDYLKTFESYVNNFKI